MKQLQPLDVSCGAMPYSIEPQNKTCARSLDVLEHYTVQHLTQMGSREKHLVKVFSACWATGSLARGDVKFPLLSVNERLPKKKKKKQFFFTLDWAPLWKHMAWNQKGICPSIKASICNLLGSLSHWQSRNQSYYMATHHFNVQSTY